MQAKMEQIKQKVAQTIALAEAKFNIKMPAVAIRFDLTGRAAGMAGCKGNAYYLRFNIAHMAMGGQTWEHMLNDVVPHEIAHTVCQSTPTLGRRHDTGWKRVCVALGGNGRRTYSADDAPEAVAASKAKRDAKSTFAYVSTSGHRISVSQIIHAKIQRGAIYTVHNGGGKLNQTCEYSVAGSAVLVRPAAPVSKPVEQERYAPAGGISNASLIRAYIAKNKAIHGSEAFEMTVNFGCTSLGMSRTLARTYTKNNWNMA